SSRRRHTRFSRDWSSDVCSSDLELKKRYRSEERVCAKPVAAQVRQLEQLQRPASSVMERARSGCNRDSLPLVAPAISVVVVVRRSEERRVGKACRVGWAREQEDE